MRLEKVAQLIGCSCSTQDHVTGFCIDSRKCSPGDLFIALSGSNFDGNNFINEAFNNGAVAAICLRKAQVIISRPQFVVDDVLRALTSIAIYHRQSFQNPVIALTGSNGKTTVKEMIASMLPQPSYATPGNFNNHLGVPLSLLQLKPAHRYGVFELGANHAGEIAHTVGMVRPNLVLINNIGPAHMEGFGSLDGVAKAKGEIIQNSSGIVVINEDDDYAKFWDPLLVGKQTLRFSLNKSVDVSLRNLSFNSEGCARFELLHQGEHAQIALQIPGEHTVQNALAAATACFGLGISISNIAKGLEKFHGVAGRMTFLPGKNQSVLIDDTYNANLASVKMAIKVLARRAGRRILVLGDMAEQGQWVLKHHQEVGLAASSYGIDLLMTYGTYSNEAAIAFGDKAKHYSSKVELAQDLLDRLDTNTTVLVKGSRSSAMEEIVGQMTEIQ